MALIVQKHQYKPNRKKIFEHEDLKLWLNTKEARRGELPQAVLELKRRKAGSRSQWDLFWSGVVKIEKWGAQLETTKLGTEKSK